MRNQNKLRQERRENCLCIDCGAKSEIYVRCDRCRSINSANVKAARIKKREAVCA